MCLCVCVLEGAVGGGMTRMFAASRKKNTVGNGAINWGV